MIRSAGRLCEIMPVLVPKRPGTECKFTPSVTSADPALEKTKRALIASALVLFRTGFPTRFVAKPPAGYAKCCTCVNPRKVPRPDFIVSNSNRA
jgi:hypothetical protein